VVSAPSGGGKTTIVSEVTKSCPGIKRSVSCTTRPSRPGEESGVDYHFVSETEFKAMAKKGLFLEWAEVYGRFYGTPRKPIQENIARGIDMALAIDIQGARSVRSEFSDAVFIFIIPPSMEELGIRLKKRDSGPDPSHVARLNSAKEEISTADEYDYIIVNSLLKESVAQLRAIITAERLRRCRYIIHNKGEAAGT